MGRDNKQDLFSPCIWRGQKPIQIWWTWRTQKTSIVFSYDTNIILDRSTSFSVKQCLKCMEKNQSKKHFQVLTYKSYYNERGNH
jgi:hypothetical protein